MTRQRIRALILFGCLAVALATLAGPPQASAQSDQWDALFDRIIRLEHEMKEMRAGGGAIPLNPAVAGSGGPVEDQLRQVMGMLDEIRRTQRTLEMRLQQLEGGAPATTGTIFEQQPSPPQGNEPSFDFSQYQSAELAELTAEQDVTVEVYRDDEQQTAPPPRVLGTLSVTQGYEQGQVPAAGASQYENGGAPAGSLVPETVERAALDGSVLPQTGPAPATGAAGGGPAEKLYAGGYESLLGRRFGDAEGSFKMFVDRYRDHPLASDAHFWLGETYYVQGDYKQAAQSFLKGYKDYPQGRKAPDTLFKLALSLQQLDQTSQACSTFAEVAKKYPTAANVRNEALKEMQRAGC